MSKTNDQQDIPETYEQIVNAITERYDSMSKRNQQVARYITQNPVSIAVDSVNQVASKCELHPSVLVRFAQQFGYSGFKQMQTVFQSRLETTAPGFDERVSALKSELEQSQEQGLKSFVQDLIIRDIDALKVLLEGIHEDDLLRAATILKDANTIFIVGQLRSEPIALIMRYLLTMLRQKVVLLDPAGGLAPQMARTIEPSDALIAIAFRHYAKETVEVTEGAAERDIPVIGITDSILSPLAKCSEVLFTIPEEEYSFSRSLAASMSLTQCIALAVATLVQEPGASPQLTSVTERL